MHLPDSPDLPVCYSGSAAGNQKSIVHDIPADGTFVLTLMGSSLDGIFVLPLMRSLSRMLDQGLLLQVVVETKD